MRASRWSLTLCLVAGCAAREGADIIRATPDAQTAPRDTGPRPTDRGPLPRADVIAAQDVVTSPDAGAMDAGAPLPDVVTGRDVWIFDAPAAPMDVPVARDVPPVMLGDVWDTPRDADTRPRDMDFTAGTAPTDSATRFNGTEDSARAPSMVYPEAGVILPPNLTGFEVHFLPGTGNDLFEVSLRGDRGAVRIFTPCTRVGSGCVLSLTEPMYQEVARAAQPSGQVTLTVRGSTVASGGRVGRSESRVIEVTNTDVRGGLYYWNAASGSILRFEFGRVGARAETYLQGDPLFNCMGCHVLSRDGSRAVVGRFIPGPAISRVYDVPTRTGLSADFGANFGTFSPDNSRVLTSDGARLSLLDGRTFAGVTGLPADIRGSMPDWSRNGQMVVFSRQRNGIALFGQPGHGAPGDLLLMRWSGSAFAMPTTLVMAGANENNYYPSFAPDDRWVVFNRSGGTSYNAIDAHLWATRVDSTPVRLARADGTGDLGNSWPKFAPFLQTYQGDTILWITFSSRRDYGLRLQQQTREPDMRTAQLWMAAIRPNRTGDPSAAAFWLPFQDIRSGNHIGQWAQEVQRMGCTSDRDCNGQERCAPVGLSSSVYGCVPR
jgi:hypothetical protein